MGFNKTFILVGFSLAIVFLISSEVAARELVNTDATTHGGGDGGYHGGGGGGYHGGGGHHGSGGGGHHGGGGGCSHGYCHHRCCNYAGEVVEGEAENTEVKPHN